MIDKYIMNPIKNFILGLIVKYFNSVETIKEFDLKWFYKINHFKYRNSTLNSFMLAMTQLGEAWLPLILVILGQQYLGIHVEVVQKIIWSFAISGLITQIIKHAMDRERPTKLEDAIEIKKDSVLSSDNFTKDFINVLANKSNKQEIDRFNDILSKIVYNYLVKCHHIDNIKSFWCKTSNKV